MYDMGEFYFIATLCIRRSTRAELNACIRNVPQLVLGRKYQLLLLIYQL